MTCRICGHTAGHEHRVREMMFGTRDEFTYFECAHCGCLQLTDPPADMAAYYPPGRYYAFEETPQQQPVHGWRKWIKRRRDAALLFDRRGPFRRLAARFPNPGIEDVCRWLAPTAVRDFHAAILDVGCGSGHLLYRLADLGFDRLTGIDPHLPANVLTPPVELRQQSLDDVPADTFDLIMFHHAFEHVPDPLQTLTAAARAMTERGTCLIRLPIASRGPWRIYGTDWAELDAPRHYFLHTEYSLAHVARQAGLQLQQVDYEPEPFSYAASELYRRGVSLFDAQAERMTSWWEHFSSDEAAEFAAMAQQYNVPGWAGRAAFFFRHDVTATVKAGFAPSPERSE